MNIGKERQNLDEFTKNFHSLVGRIGREMSSSVCVVSKLPFFTSIESLPTPKTYPSLSSKPPLFSSITHRPRFQRPIRATAASMETDQSVGTSTTGNSSNPPMKLLFVEMGVGYDQHGFVYLAVLGYSYYIKINPYFLLVLFNLMKRFL